MQSLDGRVQGRLPQLRLKELKEVLARLGLPRVGAKAVLLDRIAKALEAPHSDGEAWDSFPIAAMGRSRHVSKEAVERAVDDVWQAWHRGGGARTPEKREPRAPKREGVVRCVCHTLVAQGAMVQCCDCRVWQHNKCVALDDGAALGEFRCEACRLAKGDPFSVAVAQPLPAAKLRPPLVAPVRGDNMMQQVERTFQLTAAHRDMLLNPDHDLQVYSVLLDDPVPYRCHWPAYPDLRINGMVVRVTGRQGQQKLGVGGRDETPSIATVARDGLNRLSLSAYDDRPFCVGVRIIEKRSLEEIMARVPGPEEGETFEDALARVKRVVAGSGGDAEDSDDELMTLQSAVSVRDPMSGVRIQVPGRFRSCSHLACFDLPTLVEVNRRARKWQCPHCLHNCSLDDLIIDPYFHRVLAIFSAEYDTDCTDLEIAPDGSWRAFLSGDAKKAAGGVQPRWHKPEETTYVPPPAEERPAVVVKKEDEGRRGSGILKIRLKRDRGDAQGAWQIERHANGDEERPAKLARIDADGGSSDHKSDVNKALATDEGGKGKTTVIDLSDSDDDDLVVAAPPADKKIANGWGGGAAAPVHGPAQHEARGLHDLLAAAAAADGPSESGGAPGSEGQPQSSPHTADAQPGGAAQGEEMWGRGGGGRYWGEARMQGLAEPRHPAGPPPLEGGFVAAPSFDTGVSAAFSLPCSPRFGAHPGDGAEAGRRLPSFVHSNSEVSRGPGFRRYAEPGRLERGGGEGLVPSWPPRKVTASSHPKGQRTNRTSSPARWGDFVGCSGADMYAAPAEQRNGFGGAGYGAASLGGGGATSGRQTDAVDPRNGFGGSNFDRYGGGGVGPSGADSHPPGFGPGECADTGAARGRPADFDPFPGGGLEDDTTWRGYLERERSPEQAGQAEHGAGGGDWFPGSGQFDAGGLDPGAGRDGGGRNGGRDGDNMDAWFRDTFGADDMGHFGGLEDSARGGLGAGGVWH